MKNSQTKNTRAMRDQNPNRSEDLFDEDILSSSPKSRSVRSVSSHKKKKSLVIPTLILILAVAAASCLGVLYLNKKGGTSTRTAAAQLQTLENEAYTNYTDFINSAVTPEGVDEAAMNTLKTAAIEAYDRSRLDLAEAAAQGDVAAEGELAGITEVLAQPERVTKFKDFFSNLSNYPAAIINKAASGPAMVDFVLAYPEHVNDTGDQNATVATDNFQNLKTYDTRWAYVPYGNGLFVQTGVLPTAISEVFSYILQDGSLTPLKVAEFAREYGYDTEPIRADDTIFSGAALTYGVSMNPLMPYFTQINEALTLNDKVVIGLNEDTAPSYLVLTGVDENGNWIVENPLDGSDPTPTNPDDIIDSVSSAYAFWVE